MKKILLSLFAVAFSLGMSAQTNLLENGDFETWVDGAPTNWGSAASVASNATISQETANVHGGSSAVKLAAATSNKRLAYKPITLKAGTYTLSYYGYGDKVKQGYAIITDGKVADTQNDYVYSSTENTVLDADAWTQVSIDFTLEETKTVSIIIMRQKKSTDEGLIVDDVTLTTTDGGIEDGGSTVDPGTGDGIANTEATAYSVAKAHELIAAGEDLDTEVYVKGIVTSVSSFNTSYGSITYYLGDTADDANPLQIYGGLYYDGAMFNSKDDLQAGDEIVVKGLLKSYNGTDEMDKNNVVISHKRDGKTVTPSGQTTDISNSPETAYSIADAIKLIDAGEGLTTKVYTKGYIVGTPSVDTGSYGNATYMISDVKGDETTTITVYRGYYLDGEKFTSEDQIAAGDEVVVYGNLTYYASKSLYEINSGNYIYSINGTVSGINTIEESKAQNAPIYNMAGQRVSSSAKGLLIQNGKKFIAK